ncbi:MAG: MotA/TolQ/ExbB proton channel family protein, partial [Deltaproteobacteria bacterium]|nr:MotA/TolQ/ExbB proton channel family protein [Deltaproteobacteria bacterium]
EPGRLLSLFENRVSEVIVGMTLWSLFLLLFKYLHHRRQHRVYLAFLRPEVRSLLTRGIYARNARQAQQAIDAVLSGMKLSNHRNSVIFRRVTRLLQLSRSAPKKEGLNELLDYQAQLDVKRLEISYSILHVFLWAIPILGFIGTVMGIGSSVGEFAGFIQTAEGGAQFGIQMRTALSGVTSGLAVAFNTTFLALVLVIPVMLLTSFLSKSEEELLLGIEEFCLEDLLPHLHITPGEDALAEGFEEHMHRILRLSDTWLGQFGPLVSNLSSQTQSLGAQMAGIQPVIREFTDRLLETGPASAPEAGRSADRSSGPGSTGTTLEEAPPSARAQADPARDGNEEETTGQG